MTPDYTDEWASIAPRLRLSTWAWVTDAEPGVDLGAPPTEGEVRHHLQWTAGTLARGGGGIVHVRQLLALARAAELVDDGDMAQYPGLAAALAEIDDEAAGWASSVSQPVRRIV